jgi:hypothetical protein
VPQPHLSQGIDVSQIHLRTNRCRPWVSAEHLIDSGDAFGQGEFRFFVRRRGGLLRVTVLRREQQLKLLFVDAHVSATAPISVLTPEAPTSPGFACLAAGNSGG